MQVTLKQPWMDRPVGSKVIVNELRACALIEDGIAEAPTGVVKPESKEADLTEALGIPEAAPVRKPGRPSRK